MAVPDKPKAQYETLAAFSAATGQEKNGLFADPLLQNEEITQRDLERAYLEETVIPLSGRLLPGSPCIDRGVPIRGINEGLTGKAPDIGALEGARAYASAAKG